MSCSDVLLSSRVEARRLTASTEHREKALFWVSWEALAQQAANMLFDFDTLPSRFLFFVCFFEELKVATMSSWSKITS